MFRKRGLATPNAPAGARAGSPATRSLRLGHSQEPGFSGSWDRDGHHHLDASARRHHRGTGPARVLTFARS